MLSSNFLRRYARVFTVVARIVGVWFILGGAFFLFAAWATPTDRATDVFVGLLVTAIGIGMLIARPVTGEQLESMSKSMRNDQD